MQFLSVKHEEGFLRYTLFGLHGFRCTHLRKIINIKKIVRFAMQKSVIHDFQTLSREILIAILGLYGAFRDVTPRITENSLY